MFWKKWGLGAEAAAEEADPAAGSPQTVPTGDLHTGMRLNVTSEDGVSLFTGRVSAFDEESLTLERTVGMLSFPICEPGTAVTLVGYDSRKAPVYLCAIVKSSTRVAFQVHDIQVNRYTEHRAAFRLPVDVPVSLYLQDDENMQRAEKCTLINISTGGCCVQSEYIHIEDEVVRLRIKLEDYAPMVFLGQVVRCTERAANQYWYGILFAQMSPQETESLTRTLYNIQAGDRQLHQRTPTGHW